MMYANSMKSIFFKLYVEFYQMSVTLFVALIYTSLYIPIKSMVHRAYVCNLEIIYFWHMQGKTMRSKRYS